MTLKSSSSPTVSTASVVSWTALATAAALLVSAAVVAAPQHRQAGGKMQVAFAQIDANGDGAVSRAEYDAHLAAIGQIIDLNSDGSVSFEEAKAYREAKREERARARFARLDSDGDGVISTTEVAQRQERRFERLDRNDDGVVEESELRRRGSRGRG